MYLHCYYFHLFLNHLLIISRKGKKAGQIFPTIKELQLNSLLNETIHVVPAVNWAVHSGAFIIKVFLADSYFTLSDEYNKNGNHHHLGLVKHIPWEASL